MEMASLRLRVIFEDRMILSKSQKKDGLKRSWVLLKPQLDTISDVVSYLLHCFDLHDSCPHGIILSMDGFVLPPFESTVILKDKDLIRVKRKHTKLHDVTKAIEGANASIEDEIIEKQPLPSGVKLLANEEYNKETGGYESETDEDEGESEENVLPLEHVHSRDVVSKKRKASSKIESSKTKRQRQVTPESVQKKYVRRCERSPRKKRKHENEIEGDPISNPKVSVKGPQNVQPASDSKKCSEANGNRERTIPVSRECDGAKKVTRSTKRKRLQRMWKKIHRAKEKRDKQCESQLPVKDVNADSGSKKDACTNIIEHQQAVEESDAEGDLVPVVIRPGHIRFTPSGKVKDVQQNQETNGWDVPSTEEIDQEGHSTKRNAWGVQKNKVEKETFQWNGITNKRKGQKWGTEKQPTSSWKESRDYNVSSSFPQQDYTSSHGGRVQGIEWNGTTNNRKGQKWGKEKQPTSTWKESRYINARSSDTWAARKRLPSDAAVDFEKLLPLTDLPKAGDVIAYRLLELSSSWCPELSSFRIGKITRFEPESNRIMLVPDPEYPLDLEKKTDADDDDDASGQPPESSVFNEDGSLEIDFPSLVDVRIVKRGDPSQPEGTVTPAANGTPAPSGTSKRVAETLGRSKNVASDVSNGEVLQTPTPANGKRDVWEEISDALSAKKAQLMKDDSWNKKDNSAKRSWSHRSLRGSALGPTMAMLRAQNGI